MKRLFNILLICFLLLASLLVIMDMQACSHSKTYQVEKLASPCTNPLNKFSKFDYKKEIFFTRVNIINDASRIGGGFGCAK